MNHPIIFGQGSHKVIALHGWFGRAGDWGSGFVDNIDRKNYSWALMDYRGYGSRRASSGPFTMEVIAQDALALADQLGWHKFSLVGHSMGGMAMQKVLALAPERVNKLVGIAPVPANGVPFDEASWAFFSSAAKDPAARRGILDMTTGKRLTATWLDTMVANSLAHSSEHAFAEYLLAWAKTDFAASIQGKLHPVKVLVGEHDPAMTMDVMKSTYLSQYPNSSAEVLSNAGHYPMFETPLALISSIENFLKT